jgi:hypothetical protein
VTAVSYYHISKEAPHTLNTFKLKVVKGHTHAVQERFNKVSVMPLALAVMQSDESLAATGTQAGLAAPWAPAWGWRRLGISLRPHSDKLFKLRTSSGTTQGNLKA